MTSDPPIVRRSNWLWIALGLGLLAPLYLLRPILLPFLLAAILAYVCLPMLARELTVLVGEVPASAVLAVAVRHFVRRHHTSEFYNAP